MLTTVWNALSRKGSRPPSYENGIIDAAGAQNVLKMNVEDCKVNTTLCGNVKPTDSVDVSALYDNSFAQKVKK